MLRSLLNKFRNATPVAKASMALLFANLVLKGLSLISGPIFTRIMPQAQYGIVSTFHSWESLLTVIVTLNLAAGVFNNGMLDFKEDRSTFQFSLLVVSSCISVLAFIVFTVFKQQILTWLELPEIIIYLMLLKFLFVPAYSFWAGRQRFEYKYKALVCITIANAISSMTLGIVGVLNSDPENAAVTRIIAMESVSITVGIVFFIILAVRARFHFKPSYCKYAMKFNVPLVPHYLSMYVLSSSDRIMITKLVDSSATAIYSVAYTVASVITIVWQSIEASLSPWIYEKLHVGDIKPIRKVTAGIIALFAVMCLGSTLVAPEIMMILAPAEYSSGIYVIPPVAAGVFFTAMYSIYMRIELYHKKTSFATIATTCAALLNIVLNYIFIKLYGAIAAGYTTLFCYATLALLHYLNIRRKGYQDIVNNKAFLVLSMAVIAGSIIISIIYDYPIIRFSLVGITVLTAVIKRKTIIKMLKLKNMK